MTGRELVLAALRNEATPRPVWVPFVGSHAARLLGLPATDYLQSADHIVQGVQAGIDRYQADGIPVLFDLQLEAEVLGCALNWSDDNPPAVISHPLGGGCKVADLSVPPRDAGRIALAIDATARLRRANPDVALYGLITGPFTLGLHLLGTEIFMRMFDSAGGVHELLGFCANVGRAMADYYLEAGCDVIAVVDPMTSQIGPDQFRQFVTPHATPLFAHVAQQGGCGSFFVCGHAQQNLQAMCECGPCNVSVDENIPLDFVRRTAKENDISFGGNLQLTSTLLLGTAEQCERHALETIDVGGDRGFILAPGCDLPYATPPENLEAIGRLVRDPYRQETVRALAITEESGELLDLSNYGDADRVIVDIITLDSEACTPCQYMVESVRKVVPHFDGIVEWREHKIKNPDEIVFMSSLLVKNIPTICIDGRITFVSRIPPEDQLIDAIQRRIYEKMKSRIRQRRAAVYLLGEDDAATSEVAARLDRAIKELGVEVDVIRVRGADEIAAFGVHAVQTPAIVTAKYELKSTKSPPETAVLREWIKSLLQ